MSININGTSAYDYIQEKTTIEAISSDFCSELKFVIYLKTFPESDGTIRHYGMSACFGELVLSSTNEKIGDLKCLFPSSPVNNKYNNEVSITVFCVIDLFRFKKLEEKRKGDIRFFFKFQVYIYEVLGNGRYVSQNNNFIADYLIPQSVWVNDVLSKLNFGKYELFEVPIPEKTVAEEFTAIMKRLESARSLFNRGDYEQTVTECRKVVEHIPTMFKIDLPAHDEKNRIHSSKVKAFVAQHLKKRIQSSKQVDYIEARLTQIYRPLSDATHSLEDKFNRFDAEIILFDTISILSYIGKVLKYNVIIDR